MNLPCFRFTFFLLVYLALPLTATAQVVDILDPNLRAAIEGALGKNAGDLITTTEVETLTGFAARNANISNLTGLEHATNLRSLGLDGEIVGDTRSNSNSVSDLSPLAGLTNLTELWIGGNAISDLSPLAGLTHLTWLTLEDNSISDISALAGLINLTKLNLDNNTITDISVLAGLTQLTRLRLRTNRSSDVSPLAGLINLTELHLGGNGISNISPLAGLTNLTRLYLWGNTISDLSALEDLTNLTWLRLGHSGISDLSPLIANTGLGSGDTVDVRGNPLNYASIKTHIPTLQSRGVTVEFDDTTHLNFGEPRTVRMIYFLPNDRPYRADVVQRMKDEIRNLQTFYAEQIGAHGHGNKTFRVETDPQGEPVVHRVDGQHPNSHYYTEGTMRTEITQAFNLNANLYFIVTDTDVLRRNDTGQPIGGAGERHGKIGGYALVRSEFSWELAAHELGHGFGLWHDFRDGAYIMSYNPGRNRLSACHAEYLAMHPYFNPHTPIEEVSLPIIELISPHIYPAGSKSIPVQLKVSDSEGLHQVILVVETIELHGAAGSLELKACRGLSGKKEAIVEFEYDGVIPSDGVTSLSNPVVHPIHVEVVDTGGNVTRTDFVLFSEMLQPLSKISGNNQHGLPNTPLPVPFVIEVRDLKDGSVRRRIAVTFTVTASGGTLSVTSTMTDENGRAESTLTLGPNLGTNIVEVSAAGIEQTVIFNAVAGAGVDIPDPNLRAAIATILGKALGDPIAPSEMAALTEVNARNAAISDLTGLEFGTNLTALRLHDNHITDISVLPELTKLQGLWLSNSDITDVSALSDLIHLRELGLGGNNITDISALANLVDLTSLKLWDNSIADISSVENLTQLTRLHLHNNRITNISVLSGLTQLTELRLNRNSITDLSPLVANTGLGSRDTVDVRGNPLSYLSIHTHIPTFQSRGVTVEFDNRTHPALLKISGDNQKGASFAPLSQPFVVEAQDENGSALAGISVTFAVTAGGGTLSATITRTDKDGRAQSTLTLGPNLGTNTVEVSATGIEGTVTFHAISDTESPPITADVNNDGSVNILDLILIASDLGNAGTNLAADVSRDGIVNILDLILVAGMFDGAAAAPSAQPQVPETLTAVEVQGWLTDARSLKVRDPIMKRGFVVLEQLLVSLTPRRTKLLANYPNPFNPETWIPYRLAEDAFVTLTIYDGSGRVIRTLDVGHRIAAVYESRSKAIYWDGRNGLGEQVASGVYFYTLTAGDYSVTRKMVILK